MITLDKAALVAAIKKVIPGVEKGKSTIEGADQLLFSGKFVHSYNGVVAVSAPCDTQGQEFAVKGIDFYKLVDKTNDLILTAEIDNGKLKVKSGRTKVSMALLDPQKIKAYVAAINVDAVEFQDVPAGFVDGVRISAMGGNSSALKGIAVTDYKEGAAVITTDSKRICLTKLPSPMSTFWVDDSVITDALKCGEPTGCSVTGPWLHLRYEDGTVFSAQRKDHTAYPFTTCKNYVDAIDSATVMMSGRLPQDIKDAVSRVSILASSLDGKTPPLVELTFRKDELELHAEKQGGEATETIPWDVPPSADPEGFQVWVGAAWLIEAVNKTVEFSLVTIGGNPSLIFKSEDYVQMVSTNRK